MTLPALSVIIVTWNGWTLLERMLQTLYLSARAAGTAMEVIVVDNGSTDETVPSLARQFPDVRIIPLGRNAGFAFANNRAAEQASAALIALLNNDIELETGCVGALVRDAEAHPRFDVFAPQMLILRKPELVDNRGIFRSIAGHVRQRDSGQPRLPERESDEVFGASGGACVLRRSLLERIGLFDESFETYLEDVDFAERARAAGARCRYVSDAVILHHGSATAGSMPDWKFRMLTRNASLLRRRWLTPAQLRWWTSRAYVAFQGVKAVRSGRFGEWLAAIRSAAKVAPMVAGVPAPLITRHDAGTSARPVARAIS